MRELARQEPLILRDKRLQVEWVARGKYPVSIAASTDLITQFKNAGALLSQQLLKEEIQYVISGSGNVTLLKGAPHTNAAKAFINWLLSSEGQTHVSRISLVQSSRIDVPSDHLAEEDRRDPNIKYYRALTEDFFLKESELQELAHEIFGPLIK